MIYFFFIHFLYSKINKSDIIFNILFHLNRVANIFRENWTQSSPVTLYLCIKKVPMLANARTHEQNWTKRCSSAGKSNCTRISQSDFATTTANCRIQRLLCCRIRSRRSTIFRHTLPHSGFPKQGVGRT